MYVQVCSIQYVENNFFSQILDTVYLIVFSVEFLELICIRSMLSFFLSIHALVSFSFMFACLISWMKSFVHDYLNPQSAPLSNFNQ